MAVTPSAYFGRLPLYFGLIFGSIYDKFRFLCKYQYSYLYFIYKEFPELMRSNFSFSCLSNVMMIMVHETEQVTSTTPNMDSVAICDYFRGFDRKDRGWLSPDELIMGLICLHPKAEHGRWMGAQRIAYIYR